MTTIVGCPKRKVLVTDSMVNDEDQKWVEDKVQRIRGSLYGTAGDAADAELFYGWIKGGRRAKKPQMHEDFAAISLTVKGLFWWDSNLVPMARAEPCGIGSGGKCALAAMMAGAPIEHAVEIACLLDAGSGGPVVVHKLKA